MNGTAIGRGRRELPLRGTKKSHSIPSAAKRYFSASALPSRAIYGMVLVQIAFAHFLNNALGLLYMYISQFEANLITVYGAD